MSELEDLLRVLIRLNARLAFPEDALRDRIGESKQLLEAYNLCDGSRSQADVVKELKMDQGQFSRAAGKWVEEGILFKLGSGRDVKLFHLYPVSHAVKAKQSGKTGTRTDKV